MSAIENFEHKGVNVEIWQDEDADSPRNMDNLGVMVYFHTRYNLGDKHDYRNGDFTDWEDLKQAIVKEHDPVVILPVYMMDHSGISVSTTSEMFRAFDPHGFDWGQVGWIFCPRKRAHEWFGVSRIMKERRLKVECALMQEVGAYSLYLGGEVYGYTVTDSDGETLDCCGGFFGIGDVRQQAKLAAESLRQHQSSSLALG